MTTEDPVREFLDAVFERGDAIAALLDDNHIAVSRTSASAMILIGLNNLMLHLNASPEQARSICGLLVTLVTDLKRKAENSADETTRPSETPSNDSATSGEETPGLQPRTESIH